MDRLGSVLGFDPSPFHTIFEIREGHKRERDVDVQATFDKYLTGSSRSRKRWTAGWQFHRQMNKKAILAGVLILCP